MKDSRLVPDVVTYTTLIDAFKRVGDFERCWELFAEVRHSQLNGESVDEQLLSFMVRICSSTHEGEKALKLWAELESDGFLELAKPYNSIMFALGSTKRFAELAIEYWHKMQLKGITPDRHTYVAVLKATAKIGDTQTAYDALKDMKMHDLPMTEHVYNGLISTYAGAAGLWNVKEEHIDLYIKDSWELFRQMEENPEAKVTEQVIGSMLQLYCKALRLDELEAKVLPLYAKHKLPYSIYTYQNLSKLYLNLAEYDMVKVLYRK